MKENDLLKIEFETWCESEGFKVQKEQVFKNIMDTDRRFRADYLLTLNDMQIIVEINGGHWISGRHNRGKGYENDLIKSNLAQTHGFKYLQYTYGQLKKMLYVADLKKLLTG